MPGYAIYARLSRKPAGRKRNDRETVQRQEMLCRKYAAENGIAVSDAHIYVDNHRSAWQRRAAQAPGITCWPPGSAASSPASSSTSSTGSRATSATPRTWSPG